MSKSAAAKSVTIVQPCVTVMVPHEIPVADIESALESAARTGIAEWGRAEFGAESCQGVVVTEKRVAGVKRHAFDLAKVTLGLAVCAAKYPHHFRDFVSGDGDAYTGNVILQCALFGGVQFE